MKIGTTSCFVPEILQGEFHELAPDIEAAAAFQFITVPLITLDPIRGSLPSIPAFINSSSSLSRFYSRWLI